MTPPPPLPWGETPIIILRYSLVKRFLPLTRDIHSNPLVVTLVLNTVHFFAPLLLYFNFSDFGGRSRDDFDVPFVFIATYLVSVSKPMYPIFCDLVSLTQGTLHVPS